jgi:hypothetical protein
MSAGPTRSRLTHGKEKTAMLMWSPDSLQTMFLALRALDKTPLEVRRETEIIGYANAPPRRRWRLWRFRDLRSDQAKLAGK